MPLSDSKKVSTKGLSLSDDIDILSTPEALIYRSYIQSCLRTAKEWDLTIDGFKYMLHAPCFYCGIKDVNSIKIKPHGVFRYNGIDRVDNNIGYTIPNTVTCCKICNSMKGKMGYDRFIRQVVVIYDNVCGIGSPTKI